LATANRGAFLALAFGIVYSFWIFRRLLNPVRLTLVLAGICALYFGVQLVLDQFTYAASIMDRLTATRFEGVVPDNRTGTWVPALERSFEHIFIGHGPWYDVGVGLTAKAWPHNAYIYNLYTLGLVGLSAMLLIRYRVLKISVDRLRANPPGRNRGLAVNLMGVLHIQLIMHFLHMIRTDFERPGDDIYIYVVWMLFGLIVATANIQDEQRRRAATTASD
jgi:O-antigen ligase